MLASNDHPNAQHKNAAIIWARYLSETKSQWVILAVRKKVWRPTDISVGPQDLVSLAVLSSTGQVLLDCLIRPDTPISKEALSVGGFDQSLMFKAQPFAEVSKQLQELISNKTVVCWDVTHLNRIMTDLARKYGQTATSIKGESVMVEYSRFIGESEGGSYKVQSLPGQAGSNCIDECRNIIELITKMACTSQIHDFEESGKAWTAEFYRPKISPGQQIKDFFGRK